MHNQVSISKLAHYLRFIKYTVLYLIVRVSNSYLRLDRSKKLVTLVRASFNVQNETME